MSDVQDLATAGYRIDSSGGYFSMVRLIDASQVPGGNFGSIDTPDFVGAFNAAVTRGLALAASLASDQAARLAMGQAPLGINPGYGFWDTE
jgi:hypothetical protein